MQIQLVSEQQAGWLPPIAAIVSTSQVHFLFPLFPPESLLFQDFRDALYARAK